jgi:3'5'-cyclic nucleotide phosphodiesterase
VQIIQVSFSFQFFQTSFILRELKPSYICCILLGVPNDQLKREGESITEYYDGQSTAEQNSIDLCWDLLLKASYTELRNALCKSNCELLRFRQTIVNTVLATDLWNVELVRFRYSRWEATFHGNSDDELTSTDLEIQSNRQSTALLETIVQSADIAHTMQDWNVYRKWNQKLFEEYYVAYRAGRSEELPSMSWYENELDFFDGFVIPIAQNVKDSCAFGSHGDSFLHCALLNREKWVMEGNDIVREMFEHLVLNDNVEVMDFQPLFEGQTKTSTETEYPTQQSSSFGKDILDDDKTHSNVSVRSVWSYQAAKADAHAAALARKR